MGAVLFRPLLLRGHQQRSRDSAMRRLHCRPGLRLVPDTQPLPSQTPMFLGAATLGLIFFLVSTLIAACFDKPPSANDRIEVQLQKHGADRKKRRLDDDGFTIH